ncbi:uncharacterized protein LOC109826565 [Asparagus officinalis]|uniref:uncharacterized protein LOC109826565 n=1 Tax=Asparagus officinalis TaxID=4686 RepID=UPI00098E4014|nr:uncharacterized protein LOC109826565 [Asparagus officinalis]
MTSPDTNVPFARESTNPKLLGLCALPEIESRLLESVVQVERECEISTIPSYSFGLVYFGDIIANRITSTTLIDIIGELITIGNVKEVESNGTTLNYNAVCRVITLFKFHNMHRELIQELFIIVIQLAKTKPYGGKITITNALYASKILINPDIPKVADLKKKVCTCVTLATIQKIQTDYNCFTMPAKNVKGSYRLKMVNFGVRNAIKMQDLLSQGTLGSMYKVQVLVIDHTCTTSFVLFDREAKQFIHKAAVELRKLSETA